jgi:hypothetical protein
MASDGVRCGSALMHALSRSNAAWVRAALGEPRLSVAAMVLCSRTSHCTHTAEMPNLVSGVALINPAAVSPAGVRGHARARTCRMRLLKACLSAGAMALSGARMSSSPAACCGSAGGLRMRLPHKARPHKRVTHTG